MKGFIVHNWGYKLSSILLALLVWFYARGERRIAPRIIEREIHNVEIGVLQKPLYPLIVEITPPKVDLIISGDRNSLIEKVEPVNIVAFVDIRGLEEGVKGELPLQVKLPQGIKLENAQPQVVTVELVRKKLPLSLEGSLEETISPPFKEVEGKDKP